MPRDLTHINRRALQGLPTKLRLAIYQWLFRSLVVEVKRGPERHILQSEHIYYCPRKVPKVPNLTSPLTLSSDALLVYNRLSASDHDPR